MQLIAVSLPPVKKTAAVEHRRPPGQVVPAARRGLPRVGQLAAIVIALPAQQGDEQLQIEGYNYLLLEPTGPAELPLGQIADSSRFHIRSGNYVSELLRQSENSN